MFVKNKFTVWCDALILNKNNQVLWVLRNDLDIWNLPWWSLDKWEAPWEAVVRETKEETWLDVVVSKLIWVYFNTDKDDIVFQFLCEIVWWEIGLNDEAKDIKYFDINDMPSNVLNNQYVRVREWLENRSKLFMDKFV